MSERAFVGHLISGIKHTQLYWHLHNANLATIAAFVTEYGRLEVVASNRSASRRVGSPKDGNGGSKKNPNQQHFAISTRVSPTTVPASIDRATGVFRYTLQFII
jgi:hypothetical protein